MSAISSARAASASVHYRQQKLDGDGGPITHALNGAALHAYDGRPHAKNKPPVMFKPKVNPNKYVHSALVIQQWRKAKLRGKGYENAMHLLEDEKLLYQRVPDAVGEHLTADELQTRTMQRAKAAYAATMEEQLDALEAAIKIVQAREEEQEVIAYQKSKAARAASFRAFRPRAAHSLLEFSAAKIQSAYRSWMRRREFGDARALSHGR